MLEVRDWVVDGFVLVPDVPPACCFPETRMAAHGFHIAESIGLEDLLRIRHQRHHTGEPGVDR